MAIDLDGTLLTSTGEVTENTRVALFSYLEEITLVNKIKSMILLFVYIFLWFP